MRPDLVVIGSVIPQNATQLRFIEHDQVIEAFAPKDPMRRPRGLSKPSQIGKRLSFLLSRPRCRLAAALEKDCKKVNRLVGQILSCVLFCGHPDCLASAEPSLRT